MNGIIVVDKPADMTSAQVVAVVKRTLKVKKAGHTGTLDPFASGVLVCCINQATRLARFLTHGRKRYEAVMRLGIRTDTQDFTGKIVSQESTSSVSEYEIEAVFARFLGVKEQVPPAFSALKHQGAPLYKLARKGVFVQKPSRPIAIHELSILAIDLPFVRFEVCCGPGTYVRTLCADMGDDLGCGAHLVELRRTENSGFSVDDAVSLSGLKGLVASGDVSKRVISMRDALRGLPEVRANGGLTQMIRHGKPVTEANLGAVGDSGASWIKVTDMDRNLIAVLSSNKRDGVLPYMCVFPCREA